MKKARAHSSSSPVWHPSSKLDALDQAEGSCLSIAALAELLVCCNATQLPPRAILYAGHFLVSETARLAAALQTLGKQFAKRKPG